MTEQPGKQTVAVQILPNILRPRRFDNEIWTANRI